MTIAAIFWGCVVASIIGCAFHFWRGGALKWLIFYNFCAWVGFWLGHLVGKAIGFEFFRIGSINLGPALLGALVAVFLGYWLSMAGVDRKKRL